MKYEIGKKVIALKAFDYQKAHIEAGDTGKIINICTHGGITEFCVEFDKDHPRMHDGNGVENTYGTPHRCWWFDSERKYPFKIITHKGAAQKIVITTGGVDTLARLYENGKVVKKATAKCSPEDTFDFNVGAKLAFERLTEPAAEKKEEYYNGKVVCVKRGFRYPSPLPDFTVGKIYTVNDGVLVADNGYTTERYRTLEDLCTGIGYELLPVVE